VLFVNGSQGKVRGFKGGKKKQKDTPYRLTFIRGVG